MHSMLCCIAHMVSEKEAFLLSVGHPKRSRQRQYGLLMVAVLFAAAGHWEWIVSILMSLSIQLMCTWAAVACVAAALWPDIKTALRCYSTTLRLVTNQIHAVVHGLITAVLRLPECARDIHLVLHEIRDVCHTLKCIRAKVAFLPGQPKDSNGLLIEPPVITMRAHL
jgi:hypothetical protein